MTRKPIFNLSLLVLAAILSLSPFASADSLNFTLAQPIQAGVPGGTVTFTATVSAPGKNSSEIFLNGDSLNIDSPLILNDDGFFLGFPLSLLPGDSFTGTLFTATLPSFTLPGYYDGFFTILGGSDGGAQDVLGTVTYQVNVAPEPESLVLIGAGLSTLVFYVRRMRRA